MSEDRRMTKEEHERESLERLRGLTEKVLCYGAFLGGTFTVHDLTGGTGLKEQEVLKVLHGLMEAGAAREQHGGRIEWYAYPYNYSPEFMFFEVSGSKPTVYTIDFAYIQQRRQFNAAAIVLWEAISGTEQNAKLSRELEVLGTRLAEIEKSLSDVSATLTPLLEATRTARRAISDRNSGKEGDYRG